MYLLAVASRDDCTIRGYWCVITLNFDEYNFDEVIVGFIEALSEKGLVGKF